MKKILLVLLPILLFVFLSFKSYAATTYTLTLNAFFDVNGNGARDVNETGYTSANVSLSSGQTGVTNSTGSYVFSGLPSGTYAVNLLSIPSGYKATTSNPAVVVIGTTNANVNFGIRLTPTNTPVPTSAATATPTTKPPTVTPTLPPTSSGNYGVTSKYCPQASTTNYCGRTFCDTTGTPGYECTYHSWNCSGTNSASCGSQYSDHYWSSSCDLTNTQRNQGAALNLRCTPPAPTNLKCSITSSGYSLTWNAVSHATYKVYSGSTLLASPTTTSYTGSLSTKSYTVKSYGGGREGKGVTVTCPAPTSTSTPTPTKTPTLTPTKTPTVTPTKVPTVTPTKVPTATLTPTKIPSPTVSPTPAPLQTVLSFVIGIDGIGTTGDNATNVSTGSNKNPLHKTRNLDVEIYNTSNALVTQKQGSIIYNTTSGKFEGTVLLGTNFATGNYIVKVKSDAHLKKQLPGIQNIIASQTNVMPQVNLIAGDVNNDNSINILDYNIFSSCSLFSVNNHALCDSNSNFNFFSDLDDNGTIDQFDYNLFVREYSVQNGQ